MQIQFASGPEQIPFSSDQIDVQTGAPTTIATNLYYAILGENPAGFNLLSSIIGPIAVAAGSAIEITIPSTARPAGAFWQAYIIAASTSNTPSTFVQIAKIPALDTSGNPRTLPLSLTLDEDDYFQLSSIIATPDDLPVLPVNGMLRSITSLSGNVFEFDENSTLEPNGITVLEALIGAWIFKPGNFSSYVEETTDGGGCDRALAEISPTLIRAPRYSPSNNPGSKRLFWIVNDSDVPIESGKRIKLTFLLDDVPQDGTFDSLFSVRFLGYAHISTGALRITDPEDNEFPNIGVRRDYQTGKTDLILPDDLQPNEACTLEVFPQFSPTQGNGKVFNGSIVKASLDLFDQAGTYSEIGQALGDWLYPQDDRGYVLPQDGLEAIVLKRSGIVASSSFLKVGPTSLYDLEPDTADQQAAINGDGAVYIRTGTLEAAERLRALISTEAGDSAACAWSANVAVSGSEGLTITCTYPSNGTTATIRSNYPDAIAGITGKAQLNAPYVTLYVKSGSEIRKFTDFALLDGATQEFILDNWDDGETVTLPLPSPAADFSLFRPTSATAIADGTGNFPAGTVQVAFSFSYDGNAITKISHKESDGCIHVSKLTLAEMEAAAQSWSTPVAEDEIINIPQGAIISWQTRRTTTGKAIVYNPGSTATHDGSTTWKPAWKDVGDPGRWEIDQTQKVLLSGSAAPTSGEGHEDDLYLQIVSPTLTVWQKTDPDTWEIVAVLTAPTGASGQAAFTTTTANFVQPAINSLVTVAIAAGDWIATGAVLFVESAGYYQVITPGTTSLSLKNLGYSTNLAPGTTVTTGKKVTASGMAGATGSVADANGIQLNHLSSLPTVGANQTALFAKPDNHLWIREQSNGATHPIATLNEQQTFTKAQASQTAALTPGATVAIDATQSNTFSLLLSEATGLATPAGLIDGGVYWFRLIQAGAGDYAVSFTDAWYWPEDTTPDFATDAGRLWIVECNSDGSNLFCTHKGWFTAPPMPIAYWPLDDDTYSDVINDYGLTATTGSFIEIVTGQVNDAAEFTPAMGGDRSDLATNETALKFTTDSGAYPPQRDWHLELRFKATYSAVGNIGIARYHDASSLSTFFWQLYLDSSGVLMFAIATSSGEGTSTETLESAVTIALDTWYSVVITHDASADQISIAVGGTTDNLTLTYPAVDQTDVPELAFGLGSYDQTTAENAVLTLDELKLYF